MTEELKPCPWCGKNPEFILDNPVMYEIQCNPCGVTMGVGKLTITENGDIKNFTIRHWNKRYESK